MLVHTGETCVVAAWVALPGRSAARPVAWSPGVSISLQVTLEATKAKLVTLKRQLQQVKEGAAVSTVVGTAIGAIIGGIASSSRR